MNEKELEKIITEAERLIYEEVMERKEEIEQEELCKLLKQVLL